MTIATVKAKLVSHTGTNISAMRLRCATNNNTLAALDDDSRDARLLAAGRHACTSSTRPAAGGWLEDLKVEKYKLSEEAYDAEVLRKFKAEKLKEDPEWCIKKEMAMRGEEYVPPNPELEGGGRSDQSGRPLQGRAGGQRPSVGWATSSRRCRRATGWVEYTSRTANATARSRGVLFEVLKAMARSCGRCT